MEILVLAKSQFLKVEPVLGLVVVEWLATLLVPPAVHLRTTLDLQGREILVMVPPDPSGPILSWTVEVMVLAMGWEQVPVIIQEVEIKLPI